MNNLEKYQVRLLELDRVQGGDGRVHPKAVVPVCSIEQRGVQLGLRLSHRRAVSLRFRRPAWLTPLQRCRGVTGPGRRSLDLERCERDADLAAAELRTLRLRERFRHHRGGTPRWRKRSSRGAHSSCAHTSFRLSHGCPDRLSGRHNVRSCPHGRGSSRSWIGARRAAVEVLREDACP